MSDPTQYREDSAAPREDHTALRADDAIPREEHTAEYEVEMTAEVKAFYEHIKFPGTRPMEQDSLVFLRKFGRIVAKREAAGGRVRVLDAGCGTGNTSLALAAQFPAVEFTGMDLSSASVARARKGAESQGLSNVRFREHNLLQPITAEDPFDVVLCFGVLHHTAHMEKALNTLRAALAADGTMFLWLYGAHGRYRHTLNMELLRMLREVGSREAVGERGEGSERLDDDIALAREFITGVGDGMAARDLLGPRSGDPLLHTFLDDATWIADQFLHPNEIVVTMRDILRLLAGARLGMAEWIGAPQDLRTVIRSEEVRRRFAMLDETQRLIALDLLLKMDRYFLMLHHAQEG